jgi:hypothetical protein
MKNLKKKFKKKLLSLEDKQTSPKTFQFPTKFKAPPTLPKSKINLT